MTCTFEGNAFREIAGEGVDMESIELPVEC